MIYTKDLGTHSNMRCKCKLKYLSKNYFKNRSYHVFNIFNRYSIKIDINIELKIIFDTTNNLQPTKDVAWRTLYCDNNILFIRLSI